MERTVRLSMAQALLRFLDQQYIDLDGVTHKFVQGVFGIFGHGNVTGIGEALQYGDHALPFIRANNEQGMVHAATAFARQRKRLSIYACTSSIGPGATNMITGAAVATTNRIPVLLLPGDVFACRQPDPVLQQLENPGDYSETVNDAFKPVSRYWDRINRPEQLMSACLNAMRVLTDPVDTGAVTLCLPQDVQVQCFDYPVSFFERRVWRIERRAAAPGLIDELIGLLQQAKHPLVIAGGGVRYALAEPELKQFCESTGIAVAMTQAAKSCLADSHSLCLGGVGVTGSLCANAALQRADLIVAVGTRLQDFTTFSKWKFGNQAQLVSINVSRFDNHKQGGLAITADAKLALSALNQRLRSQVTSPNYRQGIEHDKAQWQQEINALMTRSFSRGLNQCEVLQRLNQQMRADDVVVCAAGSLPGDLHRLWRSQRSGDYHVEYAFSCMGYEVSGGLGVKMAEPGAEVFVVVGDGSYLMLHSELLTSLHLGIKITVVLMDNFGFQCIRNLQTSHGAKSFGNERPARNAAVDFVAYAQALGAAVRSVDRIEDLGEALQWSRSNEQSTVIALTVDPQSMSPGYLSWWRVDDAASSNCANVTHAYQENQQQIEHVKLY